MKRTCRTTAVCLFCLAGWLPAATAPARAADAPPAGRRPNVLLIVTDDQRPDAIRALGGGVIQTPNLDAMVGAGTAFTSGDSTPARSARPAGRKS